MSDAIISGQMVAPTGRVDNQTPRAAASELSLLRLYLLRAGYLFIAAGMGSQVWPIAISHTNELANVHGARFAMLAGLSTVALLGLRYPVKMLPLLLFEVAWKLIYLVAFALPLWSAHDISEATASNISAVFWGVLIVIPMIPWRYVLAQYAMKTGDRWK
jgi:hypothetical protein